MGRGVPTVSTKALMWARETRVFFAHQSVGVDIIRAVPEAYRAQGLKAPRIAELSQAGPDDT